MGQQFTDAVHVHYRLIVGVVDGCLNLVLANLFAQQTGKLVIDGVTRTGSYDAALNGTADEGHVTDDVEQLVACTFVLPHQRLVLDVAQVGGVAVLHVQHVGQHVEAFLGGLPLVDDDGIIQVTALDKVSLEQRLNVAHKNEGAGTGNLILILQGTVERGKLRVDELRLERAHGCYRETVVGQNSDARTSFLVLHLNFLADDVPVFGGILLLDTHLVNLLHILDGRAVEDGELGAVDLYQAVVDA